MEVRHLKDTMVFFDCNKDKAFTKTYIKNKLNHNTTCVKDNLSFLLDQKFIYKKKINNKITYQRTCEDD